MNPLIQSGSLTVCRAETEEEEELYVQLAAELDDGEALSVAISISRGHALATDDRKAIRIAKQLGVAELCSTPEIVASCSGIELIEVLQAIEFRADFHLRQITRFLHGGLPIISNVEGGLYVLFFIATH